ncbi:MAG: ERCC4 domain-containing protein [Verrucomicrobiota bacterium]
MKKSSFEKAEPVLIIDSREQKELVFRNLPSERGTLYSGDYSIQGFETGAQAFLIERKSLSDLVGSLTAGRERFAHECARLAGAEFKRLLIIGTRSQIEEKQYRSRATPQSILGSLDAWEVRYGLPVVWQPSTEAAALQVERWAFRYWTEKRKPFSAELNATNKS